MFLTHLAMNLPPSTSNVRKETFSSSYQPSSSSLISISNNTITCIKFKELGGHAGNFPTMNRHHTIFSLATISRKKREKAQRAQNTIKQTRDGCWLEGICNLLIRRNLCKHKCTLFNGHNGFVLKELICVEIYGQILNIAFHIIAHTFNIHCIHGTKLHNNPAPVFPFSYWYLSILCSPTRWEEKEKRISIPWKRYQKQLRIIIVIYFLSSCYNFTLLNSRNFFFPYTIQPYKVH